MNQAAKKITAATVKSFIKKNRANLFINVKSDFDGMTDSVERRTDGFKKAKEEAHHEATLGIEGVWFVGSSRDYFTAYETATMTGYEVSNSCGTWICAIEK